MEATNAANRSPHTKASYDVAEFDSLVQQYDALKWRLVQKPGGAAVRADEYYQLYGCVLLCCQTTCFFGSVPPKTALHTLCCSPCLLQDPFPLLHSLHKQAEEGNNIAERPMWAERGGLDFDGRCRWDAWTALKDMSLEKAKLGFVQLFYEFSPSALYQDTRGGDGGD